MPRDLQTQRLAILRRPLPQQFRHPPVQVLPRGCRNRVVGLRSEQFVSELEVAPDLPQDPLLPEPGQRLARHAGRAIHRRIKRQVGEPTA